MHFLIFLLSLLFLLHLKLCLLFFLSTLSPLSPPILSPLCPPPTLPLLTLLPLLFLLVLLFRLLFLLRPTLSSLTPPLSPPPLPTIFPNSPLPSPLVLLILLLFLLPVRLFPLFLLLYSSSSSSYSLSSKIHPPTVYIFISNRLSCINIYTDWCSLCAQTQVWSLFTFLIVACSVACFLLVDVFCSSRCGSAESFLTVSHNVYTGRSGTWPQLITGMINKSFQPALYTKQSGRLI